MSGRLPTNWFNEFVGRIEHEVPLAPMTWFKLGGRARHVYRPADETQLARMIGYAHDDDVPTRVLGGGANVLIRDDGVDGIVIRLDEPPFRKIEFRDDRVIAAGGTDLMRLTLECARRGLSGLECMAGIPGTVGGAIRMNAGGRFGDIGEVVATARLLNLEGKIETLNAEQLGFAYRHSNVGQRIVLSAELQLRQDDPESVMDRYNEIWESKKSSQPMGANSAGCIFKNPPGDSAGRLIDQAGMKGDSVGEAEVSRDHANFIVTRKNATARDVIRLVERIRQTVRRKFDVELETEIDIW
ncbi:MAG: UDP-N-acetylmuramate dehydrogenase [Phycisphaerae bacterium]|nr:UDP-N-acetylmuramate dehydrogenase [Phycisphaerae bacterium]